MAPSIARTGHMPIMARPRHRPSVTMAAINMRSIQSPPFFNADSDEIVNRGGVTHVVSETHPTRVATLTHGIRLTVSIPREVFLLRKAEIIRREIGRISILLDLGSLVRLDYRRAGSRIRESHTLRLSLNKCLFCGIGELATARLSQTL